MYYIPFDKSPLFLRYLENQMCDCLSYDHRYSLGINLYIRKTDRQFPDLSHSSPTILDQNHCLT